MRWRLGAVIILFAAAALCAPAFSGVIEQTGGSNYLAIGADASLIGDSSNWKNSAVFRTPACQYDTLRAQADAQLQQMRNQGQKKLALVLWFADLRKAGDCAGFLLNSTAGRFSDGVIKNLQDFLAHASSIGYDEVQIRFAPLWKNAPWTWGAWDPDLYNQNWSVIRQTIAATRNTPGLHVIYDLGVEQGGRDPVRFPQNSPYVQKLWADYLKVFPRKDCDGFSIAMAPGRVRLALQDMLAAGQPPAELAIDTYNSRDPKIALAESEMRSLGLSLPILIQETAYDDPQMYLAIARDAASSGAVIRAVMQWPGLEGNKTMLPLAPTYVYSPR